MPQHSSKIALCLGFLSVLNASAASAQDDSTSEPVAQVPIDRSGDRPKHETDQQQRAESEHIGRPGTDPPMPPKQADPPAQVRMRPTPKHHVARPYVKSNRRWHLRLSADSLPLWIADASIDALTLTDVAPLADIGVEFEWGFLKNLPLILQLHYAGGMLSSQLFGVVETRTWIHSAQLAVQGGYRFFDRVMPYARAGLSWSWTGVSVRDATTEIDSWAMSPGFFASLGVEFSLSPTWVYDRFGNDHATAGIRAEAGYINLGWFDHRASQSQEKGEPVVYSAGLGALSFQGVQTRLGVFLSY